MPRKTKTRKKAGAAEPRRKGGKEPQPGSFPEQELFTLTELDQVRTLSHPLRVRILEALCQARTTKQVAGHLGEPPTRLYHHVAALERAGLIRLVRTRPNRGTVEKYYQAVARKFRSDPRLFSTDAGGGAGATRALGKMIANMFESTAVDLQRLIEAGEGRKCLEEEGVLSYVELLASERSIQSLRRKLEDLVRSSAAAGTPKGRAAKKRRYRLTLAFFPLDRGSGRG